MNQPDLGLKVSELRQQKVLTQEQLAKRCEVSIRTFSASKAEKLTRQSTLCSMFCILNILLLLLSWKKYQSYKINQLGRQVLNFRITMTLLMVAAVFVIMLLSGRETDRSHTLRHAPPARALQSNRIWLAFHVYRSLAQRPK